MKEEWRDIKGYEGFYQVNNLGQVKSLDRYVNGRIKGYKRFLTGKIIKPVRGHKRRSLYLSVNLTINQAQKKYFIHQLVAKAFIPNPNNLPMINHKDENPSNNRVENLEWCDAKYNNNYGTKITKISKAISQYSIDGQFIAEYQSIASAARQTGVDRSGIGKCCRHDKNYSHAGGYIWRYKK